MYAFSLLHTTQKMYKQITLVSMRFSWLYSSIDMQTCIVVLLAFCTYINTATCGFVWDDRAAILNNIDIRTDESYVTDLLYHDFWGNNITSSTSHKSYRPITVLTFRLNYYFGQFEPSGYHLVNVVLHTVSAALVLRCARIVLGATTTHGSLYAALLFAVHPVHCDSVASVVGRADVLCTAICLWSFLLYDRAIRGWSTNWPLFAISLVLVVIGTINFINANFSDVTCNSL